MEAKQIEPGELHKQCQEATLTIFHLNVHSINNKYDELEMLLISKGFNFGVVMLTETWYTNISNYFELTNYDNFVLNRMHKQGGGIAMQVKSGINASAIEIFTMITNDYEILTLQSGTYMFSTCYRPPDAKFMSFLVFLETLLDFVSCNRYQLGMCGDFNVDVLAETTNQAELSLLIESNEFFNVIESPTRITAHSSNLIDLIITNIEKRRTYSSIPLADISDNFPFFLSVEKANYKQNNHKTQSYHQQIT